MLNEINELVKSIFLSKYLSDLNCESDRPYLLNNSTLIFKYGSIRVKSDSINLKVRLYSNSHTVFKSLVNKYKYTKYIEAMNHSYVNPAETILFLKVDLNEDRIIDFLKEVITTIYITEGFI